MKSLRELVFQAETYLEDRDYKPEVMGHYRYVWNLFTSYCEENGVESPSQSEAIQIIKNILPEENYSTGIAVFHRNAINRLYDLERTGAFPKCYMAKRYGIPECFAPEYSAYENNLAQSGLSKRTVSGKLINAKRLFNYLADSGNTAIEQLRQRHIYSYISTINARTSVARSAILFFLRSFLAYLVENHGADDLLAKMFPVILVNHSESLPSVYDKEEITKAINAINMNGECARRDRAVIMLAFQLGMRAGDISNIKYENIDWRLRTVTFVQEKTKKALQLPLPDECFFSLLDYLKNERPKSDDKHIFVRSRAPHQAYSGGSAFYRIIADCFARSGVDTGNRHRGLHALRHSSAVNMLMGDTPYPVISGILGHENANTTKQYLRMDVKHLRRMSLEVPHVR